MDMSEGGIGMVKRVFYHLKVLEEHSIIFFIMQSGVIMREYIGNIVIFITYFNYL